MDQEHDILVGADEICQFCGGISRRTLKRWQRQRGFPAHMQGGRWVASKTMIREWTREHLGPPD